MGDATCIFGCPKTAYRRGWCRMHYKRWQSHGDPHDAGRQPLPTDQRFWAKVDAEGICWEWTSTVDGTGYGKIKIARVWVPAHRWAYETLVGPIPAGLELDHLCRIRRCVNPDHLEPVTTTENLRRMHAARTH